jgi:hypothetical protein
MPINNSTLSNYYYQEQIKKYMVQFMAIFSGLQVSVGVNDNNPLGDKLIHVPIVHGSKDRVAAAILAGNSPNIPVKLPTMTTRLNELQIASDRMKGQGVEHSHVNFPRGGVFPDDLKTVTKLMPIPYYFGAELNILTSNLRHKYEILEQILLLFRPDLWFQTSDDENDWTAINAVQLNSITLEENYPSGSEKRILSSTLNFQFLAWMSAPANVTDNVINKIQIKLKALSGELDLEEFKELVASKKETGEDYCGIGDPDTGYIDSEEICNIFDVSEMDSPDN